MTDDKQLREMTCNPKDRKVLVSDVTTPTGQALVRALVSAGADTVWAGHSEASKTMPGVDEMQRLAHVTLVPLDVTRSNSVRQAAAQIGANLDILINNAEFHRAHGISGQPGVETPRAEMDVNYFGLLRLAQEFGPTLRARGAGGPSSAPAWMNILSVFALANFPAHGTFSASKAAAYSLSQCLRSEMQPWGVRVINIFPGPIDDEWNQTLPPPKLSPDALARASVKALQEGIEDVYPGDVAQEWLARWRENPKVLERELAADSL
jgi:NAD(P)-dependent dehydrogenase (short-subunit alcohol dehydrogenase family)